MQAISSGPRASARFAKLRPSPPSVETSILAIGPANTRRRSWLHWQKSIYVLHDLKALRTCVGAGFDVVLSGHSHVPKIDTVGGVLYLNPGSAGRRRFNLPITLATLEVTPAGMRPAIHDLGGS